MCGRCYVALGLIPEQSCGSAISVFWLISLSGSRVVWLCFRVRREQAIMKRSGGGLPRAAWAGQLVSWRTEGKGRLIDAKKGPTVGGELRRWHLMSSLPPLEA